MKEKDRSTEPALSEILAALLCVNNGIKNIKVALDKYGDITFEWNEKLSKIEKHLESQAKHLEEVITEIKALKTKVGDLEVRLNKAEHGLLNKSLEIRGIPMRSGETPAALVSSIGAGLGIKLNVEDLDAVQRRPATAAHHRAFYLVDSQG